MKNTRFELKRKDNRLQMTDTDGDNTPLTAAQAERLGRQLIGEAKQMKRAHGLRRLLPIRLPGGK